MDKVEFFSNLSQMSVRKQDIRLLPVDQKRLAYDPLNKDFEARGRQREAFKKLAIAIGMNLDEVQV